MARKKAWGGAYKGKLADAKNKAARRYREGFPKKAFF
jgi:hypothetical protein